MLTASMCKGTVQVGTDRHMGAVFGVDNMWGARYDKGEEDRVMCPRKHPYLPRLQGRDGAGAVEEESLPRMWEELSWPGRS